MKITAISGLLLAVLASVVSAEPTKNETAARVSYNDRTKSQATTTGDWVELASPTPCSHGRELIFVDGRYSQLRIDAAKGRPIVRSVRVVYADGKQRVVRIDRVLGAGRPALVSVDGARQIEHVVVTTDPASRAQYAVHGAPSDGTSVATR